MAVAGKGEQRARRQAASVQIGCRRAWALCIALPLAWPCAAQTARPAWAYPEAASAGVSAAEPTPPATAAATAAAQEACTGCHGADGLGTWDSANLTGLSRSYLLRQLREMRSGVRQSALPQHPGLAQKAQALQLLSEAQLAAAAAYYVTLPARAAQKVVESETVPHTALQAGVRVAAPGDAQEPLGQRIVELQDGQGQRLAYVPPGSVARGRGLVFSGAEGRSARCEACHGVGLKGTAIAPVLAGRAPLYLVRQLFDLQSGSRHGSFANQMEQPVQNLSVDDMLSLAAYAASLTP